ncbi:MAG: hypothetical protein ACFFCD_08320 [Promethearchaeota archaeon]
MTEEEITITTKQMYELLIGFASLNEVNRKILLTLAHVYPRAVSGVQLTRLIGYSGKAKSLYRGALQRLTEDKLILRDKLTSKLHSLRINHLHPLAKTLIALATQHGQQLREMYENALRTDENG